MAIEGKKINELDSLTTVTGDTVLPAVYVSGQTISETAQKVSIDQISNKVQNDLSDTLALKQDKLTAGEGIEISEENVISTTGSSYVLPPATSETLGGVKIGSGLSVTEDGTVSATGGGGTTTVSWFRNKIGNTLDISSLSGTLSKVFLNGKLLPPCVDVNKKLFNATDYRHYIKIDKFIDLGTADNWLISFFIRNSDTWGDCRIMSNAISDYTTPVLLPAAGGRMHLYLSSSGSSWDLASNRDLNLTLEHNKSYWMALGFTGTQYFFAAKTDSFDWTVFDVLPSTTKIYFNQANSRISFLQTGWQDAPYIYTVSISPKDIQIFRNNVNEFNGLTAVEGTDWSNVNCNETVITEPYPSQGYKISGTNLLLTQDLFPTDQIAIETVSGGAE